MCSTQQIYKYLNHNELAPPPIFAFTLPRRASHFAFVVLIMHNWHAYKEDNFNNDGDDAVWTVFCLMLALASAMQLDQRKKKFQGFSL